MIQLSYSTFGLTDLPLPDAIDAVDRAGYPGIELSFHRDQFNPFDLNPESVAALRRKLDSSSLEPVCVSTASHFFTPSRPHEPSLLSPDLAGRKRRIDLIRRGIDLARALSVPLVSFGSGFIREEHVRDPSVDPYGLLCDSIKRCLAFLRPDDRITLLIEPEPGMFIETTEQGLRLIEEIGSPAFRLHADLCHLYCTERDFQGALAQAAPLTRFLHVSDARRGYNLKIVPRSEEMNLDLDFASYLVYFPRTADFLLVDRDHPMYFSDEDPGSREKAEANAILRSAGVDREPACEAYGGLFAGATPFDDEIFTYLISVPGLSFDVLERARPVLIRLRTPHEPGAKPLVDRMIANTLTGIVHFHEIPGEGTFDFETAFRTLSENGFSGYASVELYHHVQSWQKALTDSRRHLMQFTT